EHRGASDRIWPTARAAPAPAANPTCLNAAPDRALTATQMPVRREGGAMVARVASFEGVNVDVAEKTMDPALSIISPLMEGLPGYQGHLELVASDGRVLSIALFDSEENARAAEPTFDEEMPRQLGDLYNDWEGRRVSVKRYKVLADSRNH